MTKQLLWEEYKEQYPAGYGYSQFKEYYARYLGSINPSMRQIHYAGDKLFVDFSGLTMPIVDAITGEVDKAQIFVGVLGASGYTFVHAVSSQSTRDFIACHNQAFNFYGGVPNMVVPDNLKAAVISHKRGRITLNESYADMGRHYNVAIAPARPYHPQDKSKVELGVKGIQRWILMKLRNRTFFDIDELNSALSSLLDAYNHKIIKRIGKTLYRA
jgi:transposase